MKTFLLRFWAIAVSLATVVALYIAAAGGKVLGAFWFVVAVAVVGAGQSSFGRSVIELLVRIRNYPILLSRVASLESEVEELRAGVAQSNDLARSRWKAGRHEGRAEVRGAMLALMSPSPTLMSIVNWAGELALVVSADPLPMAGARYRVQAEVTGELKGVVEVVEVDVTKSVAFLTCAEPTASAFWAYLTDRFEYDPSAPAGVVLVPNISAVRPEVLSEDAPTGVQEETG